MRSIARPIGMALGIVLVWLSAGLAEEKVFRGELAEGDKIHKEQEAFVDYYLIQTKAKQLLTVMMVPEKGGELDTYLHVTGPSGQSFSNDDDYEFFRDSDISGSRIVFLVPEAGEWEIAATALGEDEEGKYVLTVQTQELKLLLGERGDLEKGDEILLKRGEYYDKFAVDVEAGKTYAVLAASSEFDTFLSVHYPGGLVTNDYAVGSYTMSLAIFKPKDSGSATIVMTSGSADEEGRYRLAAYETVEKDTIEKETVEKQTKE